MSDVDELLIAAFKNLPPKPFDSTPQSEKKRHSEQMSAAAAIALAEALRRKGLSGTYPLLPTEVEVGAAIEKLAEKNLDPEEEGDGNLEEEDSQ